MGDEQPASRIDWIDAAKGLGIIAVAAGHIWTPGPVRDAIYLFHMPLFFILAGTVFRPRPMGAFARRQLLCMGVPYLVFLLLLYGFDQLFEPWRGHRPWLVGWDGIGRLAMGGSALTGPFTIFWFPPCLLVARLGQNAVGALGVRWDNPLTLRWIAVATGALAVGMLAGWLTDVSPLGLLTVPVAFFLLWFGHALREAKPPAWVGWAALPIGLVALAYCPSLSMKTGDYGWPLISLAGGIALCLALFRLAAFVPWMAPLGNLSLVIMYMHVPIIHYGGPYLPKWALLFPALAIPFATGLLLKRYRLTAFLFLGKPRTP